MLGEPLRYIPDGRKLRFLVHFVYPITPRVARWSQSRAASYFPVVYDEVITPSIRLRGCTLTCSDRQMISRFSRDQFPCARVCFPGDCRLTVRPPYIKRPCHKMRIQSPSAPPPLLLPFTTSLCFFFQSRVKSPLTSSHLFATSSLLLVR